MNEEFEKKEDKETVEENAATDNQKKKRRNNVRGSYGTIAIVISLIAFVVLYAIVNISSISSVASGVISVLTPVILGFGLAYLLNPVLKFFERRVYKKIRSKGILRALSLISTYLVALLFLTAVIFLVIPQLVESIIMLVSSFDT